MQIKKKNKIKKSATQIFVNFFIFFLKYWTILTLSGLRIIAWIDLYEKFRGEMSLNGETYKKNKKNDTFKRNTS